MSEVTAQKGIEHLFEGNFDPSVKQKNSGLKLVFFHEKSGPCQAFLDEVVPRVTQGTLRHIKGWDITNCKERTLIELGYEQKVFPVLVVYYNGEQQQRIHGMPFFQAPLSFKQIAKDLGDLVRRYKERYKDVRQAA